MRVIKFGKVFGRIERIDGHAGKGGEFLLPLSGFSQGGRECLFLPLLLAGGMFVLPIRDAGACLLVLTQVDIRP
jgi:hypothetical protein